MPLRAPTLSTVTGAIFSINSKIRRCGCLFNWEREDKDNARGDVFRLNFVMQYELVALQQDIMKILPF